MVVSYSATSRDLTQGFEFNIWQKNPLKSIAIASVCGYAAAIISAVACKALGASALTKGLCIGIPLAVGVGGTVFIGLVAAVALSLVIVINVVKAIFSGNQPN